MELNWNYCQNNSDLILSSGIFKLVDSDKFNFLGISQLPKTPANYLISHKDIHYYIGETDNCRKRIKQQFTPGKSTFYNSYLDTLPYYEVNKIQITDFFFQILKINLGRKEIEEFGIVNLPTKLNKFQRGKREKVCLEEDISLWEDVQHDALRMLHEGEEALMNKTVSCWSVTPQKESLSGTYYVLGPDSNLIYFGETSNFSERYIAHSGRTYFSALRRNVGTEILGFKFIAKKKFSDLDDNRISAFLECCKYSFLSVKLGRLELEEYLLGKYKPLLNRKGND